ncbi:MAG TPA: hypothetical protein VFK89_04695, partial [Actinomycetota bacterium]|nr:hypothetical protein [Actinomycetota bacterium]
MNDGGPTAAAPEIAWTDIRGDRVVLHVAQGSTSSARARDELAEAEKVVKALEEWLEPPSEKRGGVVDVYLVDPPVDPLGEVAGSDALATIGEDAVVALADSEGSQEPLAKPLAAVLIKRWFGDKAV